MTVCVGKTAYQTGFPGMILVKCLKKHGVNQQVGAGGDHQVVRMVEHGDIVGHGRTIGENYSQCLSLCPSLQTDEHILKASDDNDVTKGCDPILRQVNGAF